MSISGHQRFALMGSRLYFQRDPIAGVTQPTVDLGVITTANPQFNVTKAQLYDSDGGSNRLVAEEITQFEETYEIQCSNLNMDNLAFLFAADPVESYSQSATPVTGVEVYAHPGRLVKLLDANGDPIFSLESVDAVAGSGGSPSYTEDTDWEVVSLDRGLIRMISGGSFAAAALIEVDYTLNAISAESRIIDPQSSGSVEGEFFLWWAAEGFDEQMVRMGRASISANGANFGNSEFSNMLLGLQILTDSTLSDFQSGKLLYIKGTLPSIS